MDFNKLLDHVKSIDLTKALAEDEIKITPEAEEVLFTICEAEKAIAEMKEKLKERFLEVAQKNPKLKKYEGDKVSVGYMVRRSKKITGNPDPKFYVLEKKPNTKAIDAYAEAMGELPTGIEESYAEYITFKIN